MTMLLGFSRRELSVGQPSDRPLLQGTDYSMAKAGDV
jgi:hypothetical protein